MHNYEVTALNVYFGNKQLGGGFVKMKNWGNLRAGDLHMA